MIAKPECIYSQTFKGKIWKLLASDDGQYLLLEVRDDTLMKVSFFSLHIDSLALASITLSATDWWVVLEGENQHRAYFKQYHADENPEVKGRFVYDIVHKCELAEADDLNGGLHRNGSPSFYASDHEHFSLIKDFIGTISTHKVSNVGAEYLESAQRVAVSYYMEDEKLANYLLITDMDKNVVFHQLLADKLSGIGLDTFMIVKNKLIFVRQKRELCIYQL